MMALEDVKFRGTVNEIGLERDENEFMNFNLTLGIRVKTDKKLTFNEGERLIKRLTKELLGKNIELEAIAIPCPHCGKTFNTETGMKQHIRRQHEDEPETPKKRRGRPKKTGKEEKNALKKRSRKKTTNKK